MQASLDHVFKGNICLSYLKISLLIVWIYKCYCIKGILATESLNGSKNLFKMGFVVVCVGLEIKHNGRILLLILKDI